MASMMALYDRLAHPYLWVRRMSVTAVHVRSQDIQDPVRQGFLLPSKHPFLMEIHGKHGFRKRPLRSIADLAAMPLSRGATYAKKP